MHVYSILIHTGSREEGIVEPERRREGKGQQFTKLGRKYQHDYNSDKHLPQSPFTGRFFR
jgi:hypothetical protein